MNSADIRNYDALKCIEIEGVSKECLEGVSGILNQLEEIEKTFNDNQTFNELTSELMTPLFYNVDFNFDDLEENEDYPDKWFVHNIYKLATMVKYSVHLQVSSDSYLRPADIDLIRCFIYELKFILENYGKD